MKKNVSKTEAKTKIDEFFLDITNKLPEEVKKIKKIAMGHNIPLGDRKKLYCKNCYNPFKESSIRIKNDMITITCEFCAHKNRWKIK